MPATFEKHFPISGPGKEGESEEGGARGGNLYFQKTRGAVKKSQKRERNAREIYRACIRRDREGPSWSGEVRKGAEGDQETNVIAKERKTTRRIAEKTDKKNSFTVKQSNRT